MDWQYCMSIQTLNSTGQVILLEAEPGQSRRDHLQQWLSEAQHNGAATWLLSCHLDEGGPWAGLKDLFNDLVPEVQAKAPDLIVKHDYELAVVLPALRQTISVRNPNLTDTSAPKGELARNYPADRAFRIVNGLIDLFYAWHERFNGSPCAIACNCYDHASVLVSRFFIELMRRRGQHLNLTLLIAIDPQTSETVAGQFSQKYLGQCVKLNLLPDPSISVCKQEMTRLAQELEQQVGEDAIDLEINLPQLIRYWLLSDHPQKALAYQIQAFSIYTERGFYEDALVYGKAAFAQLERYYPNDLPKRLHIYGKLYGCYASLGRSAQALEVAEAVMANTDDPNYLFQWCYMIAMLYARHLPNLDLEKAEAYLKRGLEELARTDLSESAKLFYFSFIHNGLALIRHRQGRSDEAVEICRSCYEQLNAHLEPDRHRLHRSVLLFNIAQVYASTGPYEEAISYLTDAMAMDPNYSEYYNDRGNLYFKLGHLQEALKDYLMAIKLSPPYWEVWSNLGQCYRLMGQITEAVNAYSTSLDLDPNQFSVLVARAEAFEMLEQPDAALADYTAALALNPNLPLVLANRAILLYGMGNLASALADLNLAITLEPENSDLYQNRAVALTTMGYFDDAVRDLQTYLRLSPNADDRPDVESRLAKLQSGSVVL